MLGFVSINHVKIKNIERCYIKWDLMKTFSEEIIFFFFFWLCLWHLEAPRPGVEPASQK